MYTVILFGSNSFIFLKLLTLESWFLDSQCYNFFQVYFVSAQQFRNHTHLILRDLKVWSRKKVLLQFFLFNFINAINQ
jgi:hypothetical protein